MINISNPALEAFIQEAYTRAMKMTEDSEVPQDVRTLVTTQHWAIMALVEDLTRKNAKLEEMMKLATFYEKAKS